MTVLEEYARLPIAFTVSSVWEPGGAERAVEPWRKDYDELDGGPLTWPARFDVTLFCARMGGQLVGGAAARGGELWDLRVRPDRRGQGLGRWLFTAVAEWMSGQGFPQLRVETQNINVPACRFYERMGCRLAEVDPAAYPELPGEVKLVWELRLLG